MEKNTITLLQDMPIFGGLTEASLLCLLETARRNRYAVDEFLFRQGDPTGNVYVLTEGRVVVRKEAVDAEFHVCELGTGDCIGELSLIDPGPRTASVFAREECRAICLEPNDFYRLRHQDLPQYTLLQLNIAREVCRRFRATEERLCNILADFIRNETSIPPKTPLGYHRGPINRKKI